MINLACDRALKLGSARYSTVKHLCEDQEETLPGYNSAQLELLQEHEIIRNLDEYDNYLEQLAKTSHP